MSPELDLMSQITFRTPIILSLLVLFSFGSLAAQISTSQYEVSEFEITLPASDENPFDRHPLATCEGPDGAVLTIPAYYSGDDRHTFRISFPRAGNWKVTSQETGDRWDVLVSEADSSVLGPVVIREDNPQHFGYANGESRFVLAFEADWLFALDLETDSLDRTKTLFRDIKDNGFNQIVMNV